MPQFGTRDVDLERDGLPVVTALASEGWASEDAEVLNLTYEFDDTHYLELLPPALQLRASVRTKLRITMQSTGSDSCCRTIRARIRAAIARG